MAVITLLFFAFYFFSQNVVSSEKLVFPCQTPDIRKGFCVSIFDCPELIKMVHEMGQEGAKFAKKSICLGCVDNETWVCCKKPSNTTGPSVIPTNDRIPDTSESDDSLAMRKKINLKQLNKNTKYCGEQHSGYRVGEPGEVEIDEYPWVVQIKHSHDEPISMRCNGVIIERHSILTTSKCGHQARTALLGQYNTNKKISCKISRQSDCTEPTKELSVTEVAHSNKDSDDQYGLTLLSVNETIIYTDFVRAICLPLNRTELSTTETVLQLSGWTDVSGNKKDVRYSPSPHENCFNVDDQLKEKVKEENISLMCLSYSDKSYCDFDFGGPLMYNPQYNKWYLDGLISNGNLKDGLKCSISNVTGIFLTPKLIDFVISNIVF